MEIIITKNYGALSDTAARFIAAQLLLKPESVLGLATGSSPLGTYEVLAGGQNDVDFSRARTVNLDEYCGLAGDDPRSYRFFMDAHLFSKVNIRKEHTHIPDGRAADADKECARYEALLRDLGGVDVQLLGIGNNGHIGFNEPSDAFEVATHKQPLSASTIAANKRFFEREEDVPRFAYTMGIGTIMRARRILLIASGAAKAAALKQALTGPVTPALPASVLRLHAAVTVIADADAAALLQ
ncbi:MAG: glucosamine-6-phosphate deaminase [Spirochaetaceae bacterium]|jgi:glucosamine-6-phosphate deaminase|nr:glucosamine-6-phosphate deaminase [Spirochaetaceae bacterium]